MDVTNKILIRVQFGAAVLGMILISVQLYYIWKEKMLVKKGETAKAVIA